MGAKLTEPACEEFAGLLCWHGHAWSRAQCCFFVQAAEAAMAAMLKLPDVGRIATKQQCRQDFVDEWRKWYPIESEIGFTQLSAPSTIEAMRGVIERLGSGRSRL
jgi:hypothetical protein